MSHSYQNYRVIDTHQSTVSQARLGKTLWMCLDELFAYVIASATHPQSKNSGVAVVVCRLGSTGTEKGI